MALVTQFIPAQHVQPFISHGLYFSPCASFVDLMEFRFAHCASRVAVNDSHKFNQAVRDSFADEEIERRIKETAVSCWTEDQTERYAMWEIYGNRTDAIAVKVDRTALIQHIISVGARPGAFGSVRYGFAGIHCPSLTKPEFLTPFGGLTIQDMENYHPFFYKHEFYRYEDEFRVVLCSPTSVTVALPCKFISAIIVSPFANEDSEVIEMVKDRFGPLVRMSKLERPY